MKAINLRENFRIQFTPAADVAAGDIVTDGSLSGYATEDIASGELGSLVVIGQAECLIAAVTVVRGTKAYWDASAELVTNVSTANTLIGTFTAAATSSAGVCNVAFGVNQVA